MRYNILTNMTKPIDKQAADVLLYLQRCRDAIKNVPKPEGVSLSMSVNAIGKQAEKAATRAHEMYLDMTSQLITMTRAALDKADAAADRASRKKTKAK